MIPPKLRRLAIQFAERKALSGREAEVMELAVSLGLSNKLIADQMGCSVRTVEAYWARIFGKLGCRSRGEALAAFVLDALGESGAPAQPR